MSGLAGGTRRSRERATAGFNWQLPEQVPGGVLPESARRELQRKLCEIDECQGRAAVRARSYAIYR